jgi:membrane protein DedA with SNARE-associated domain
VGEERLRSFVKHYGRWLALNESDLDDSMQWFECHGGMAVLIGSLVPSVRRFISIPAGLAKMPLGRFGVYTTLGSAVWNALLVAGGSMLGDQRDRVTPYMRVLE